MAHLLLSPAFLFTRRGNYPMTEKMIDDPRRGGFFLVVLVMRPGVAMCRETRGIRTKEDVNGVADGE